MLQHFGVIPFIIFDGDYLPSKAATEADRAERREKSKKAGMELLNAGKTSQAYLDFQKAVDVTPEMARQLIDELRKAGIQYLVAPYEADAQMVYLERQGIIHGILSEDSDLLVFGAKCLLTKLDQYGNCIEVNKADFCACKEISLTGWSDTEFRRMAILSGCDYLASINNMGLKTAYRMVRKHKTIEKVLRMLQFDGKFHVPKDYLQAFYQAELTFLHQRVFCPKFQGLVMHTEPQHPLDEAKIPFIGAYVEPTIAQGVARGDLNPMTKLPIIVDKETKTVTPTTPWASSRPQHQRSASSNDLKKGKPIDTFFKPKRIPLGELDPNCFTPSPSQQDTLNRNFGSWVGTPVPRQYLHRHATEPEDVPHSAPPPTLNPATRAHGRTPTVSEPRPQKRTRLCSDIDTVESLGRNVELGPSRFFSSAVPEPSPTIGRSSRNKRSKKQDITIFSDDSIEEAMLSLPDIGGFGNRMSNRKLSVFEEDKVNSIGTGNQNGPLGQELSTYGAGGIQEATPSLTASTSITSSGERLPTPTESSFLPTAVDRTKESFAFGVELSTPYSSREFRNSSTPRSLRPSRIPLAVKSNVPTPKLVYSAKINLTALQRLGANAANRLKLPITPPNNPNIPAVAKSSRRSLLSKGSVPFPEVTKESHTKDVEPALIPLPIPDETENLYLITQSGSEDLIIHDSEGENDALSPGPADECVSSRIDFKRFAYAV